MHCSEHFFTAVQQCVIKSVNCMVTNVVWRQRVEKVNCVKGMERRIKKVGRDVDITDI